MNEEVRDSLEEKGEFGRLLKYTIGGYVGGLSLGALLDFLGYQRNPVGEWAVRTLSGEGESIFEGVYALRQRLSGVAGSMAEAYGWGKFLGMTFPWFIDWGSRLFGINVYGVEGFYIPYFLCTQRPDRSQHIWVYLSLQKGRIFVKGHKPVYSSSGDAHQSIDYFDCSNRIAYSPPYRL
ncbi:MAG: hypothetical protein ABWK02_00385 [Aquificaceae bacterium]